MQQLQLVFTGTSPLLMHSDRLANPLATESKLHKQLTAKRTKTDEDHAAIALSELRNSIYWNETDGVYLPSQNLRAAIVDGGKLSKKGSAIQRGTIIPTLNVPLLYKGPKTPDKLAEHPDFQDCRSVVISGKRLMRYRPIFRAWSVEFAILFDERVLDARDIEKAADDAGALIGLGDFRPSKGGGFGRFTVKVAA